MNILKNRAFTLLELVIAAVIMAVLASISFFTFGNMVERYQAKEIEQMLFAIMASQKRYAVEHDGRYATAREDLDVFPLPSKMQNYGYGGSFTTIVDGRKVGAALGKISELTTVVGQWPWGGDITYSNRMYLLVLTSEDPTSEMKLYCADGANFPGICKKLGYKYLSEL